MKRLLYQDQDFFSTLLQICVRASAQVSILKFETINNKTRVCMYVYACVMCVCLFFSVSSVLRDIFFTQSEALLWYAPWHLKQNLPLDCVWPNIGILPVCKLNLKYRVPWYEFQDEYTQPSTTRHQDTIQNFLIQIQYSPHQKFTISINIYHFTCLCLSKDKHILLKTVHYAKYLNFHASVIMNMYTKICI